MTVKLTKKQLALLDFLQDFTEENGYSPSYREIMAGMGLSSVSAVAEHVENLVEKSDFLTIYLWKTWAVFFYR